MGLLIKKIRSSSLLEVLIASMIVIIVFFIAMMSFNSLLSSTSKNHVFFFRHHMEELEYQYDNGNLGLPYNKIVKGLRVESKISSSDTVLRVFGTHGDMIFQRNLSQ